MANERAPSDSALRRMFATTIANVDSAQRDAAEAYSAGNVASAIGAISRQAATVPAGVVYDTVARPVGRALGGVGNFLGGVVGLNPNPSTEVTRATAAASKAATPKSDTPRGPSAQAVRAYANRTQALAPTPQERALAFVDSVLSRPATIRQAQAAVGLLPAPAKPQTDRDKAYGVYTSAVQGLFQNQIANAQELAKTDPEGARKLTESASKEFLSRLSAGLGANPLEAAMAEAQARAQENQ